MRILDQQDRQYRIQVPLAHAVAFFPQVSRHAGQEFLQDWKTRCIGDRHAELAMLAVGIAPISSRQ